jgi:hypothetical protein
MAFSGSKPADIDAFKIQLNFVQLGPCSILRNKRLS